MLSIHHESIIEGVGLWSSMRVEGLIDSSTLKVCAGLSFDFGWLALMAAIILLKFDGWVAEDACFTDVSLFFYVCLVSYINCEMLCCFNHLLGCV